MKIKSLSTRFILNDFNKISDTEKQNFKSIMSGVANNWTPLGYFIYTNPQFGSKTVDSYWYIVLKFKQFPECFKVEDFVPYINHMIMSSEFKLSSIEKHSKYLKAFLKGIYDLNKEKISMLAFPFTRSTESKHGTYLCH